MLSLREYIGSYLSAAYRNAFGSGDLVLPPISEALSLLHRTMNAHGVYAPPTSHVSEPITYPHYSSVYYRAIFRAMASQFVLDATRDYSAADIASSSSPEMRDVPVDMIVPQEVYPSSFNVVWRVVQLPVGGS